FPSAWPGAEGLASAASDFVWVFRPESEESHHRGKGEHGVKPGLGPVNRRRELAAEAVELGEKEKQFAHRVADSWERSTATFASNIAKLWRCVFTPRIPLPLPAPPARASPC